MPSLFLVIFQNLAEKYPEDAHIECKYTLTRSYEPSARDWIGLYKVASLGFCFLRVIPDEYLKIWHSVWFILGIGIH